MMYFFASKCLIPLSHTHTHQRGGILREQDASCILNLGLRREFIQGLGLSAQAISAASLHVLFWGQGLCLLVHVSF